MAVDILRVYNQALSSLGTSATVESTTEKSVGAEKCNLWYETVRDAIFCAAPWPTLTSFSRLATLSVRDDSEDWVATDPPPGWLYAFALPADCLRPRSLSSFGPFKLSGVEGQTVIATNEETPILEYTRRETLPEVWGVELFQAVSFGLASHIAKSITGSDADLQNMFQLATEKIMAARVTAANEQFAYYEMDPSWMSARGNNLNSPNQRFIYPSAAFTVAGANNLG